MTGNFKSLKMKPHNFNSNTCSFFANTAGECSDYGTSKIGYNYMFSYSIGCDFQIQVGSCLMVSLMNSYITAVIKWQITSCDSYRTNYLC